MAEEPECAGVFYADGHVRVYHGKLTDLPRRYIARERLCLRGTTDSWVNAMDGRPFFVVSCAVDPGLLSALREQIVPRLKADVPNQPAQEQLEADPHLNRFTIVFDREGYSPRFFAQMKEQRIAVLTYHKFPGELWPEQEFRTHQLSLSTTGNKSACNWPNAAYNSPMIYGCARFVTSRKKDTRARF